MQALALLRACRGLDIVGADVVEVRPRPRQHPPHGDARRDGRVGAPLADGLLGRGLRVSGGRDAASASRRPAASCASPACR